MSSFAKKVLSEKRSPRAMNALMKLAERSPGFGSLVIWVNQFDADPITMHGMEPMAWTDGKSAFYTKQFDELPALEEKVGVVAHETWHCAFQHPNRARKLQKENVDFKPFIFNLAADAIINEGLNNQGSWLQLPKGCVEITSLLKECIDEEITGDEALAKYSVELLYKVLTDQTPRHPVECPSDGADGTGDGQDGESQSGKGGSKKSAKASGNANSGGAGHDGQDDSEDQNGTGGGGDQEDKEGSGGQKLESNYDRAKRYAEKYGFREDMDLEGAGPYDPAEAERDMQKWARRISQARAGEGTRGILRRLIADIPQSRTPWQHVLRSKLTPMLMPKRRKDWTRPSRRWIALQGVPGNEDYPFEPGFDPKSPAMRLVVAIDTSGSISDKDLAVFAAEIRGIQRRTLCEVYVIACDCRVHGVWKLKHDQGNRNELTSIDGQTVEFAGQGGTDFAPAIAEAAKLNPSAMVYLTDLEGPAGEPPKGFDVIWAVPAEFPKAQSTPPFGKIIEIL